MSSVTRLHSRSEAQQQAERNIAKLQQLSGGPDDIRHAFLDALQSGLAPRAKLNRLKKSAGLISKFATPFSACRAGCSHCCHISVGINSTEAKAIAKASGMRAVDPSPSPALIVRERWYKTPCPFLKKGRCSIYEDRPISCRLNINMADTSQQCDTSIPSEDSYVMYLNLRVLEEGFAMAFLNDKWADIRDFFPPDS